MAIVEQLATFVTRASYGDLSEAARLQLKIRVLDALGCAIGALGGEPPRQIRGLVEEFGGNALCTMIGGGRTAPDRAAFYNGALIRYLDFNDSYLAKGETCHPSDNLGPVLAATEYAGGTGQDLLTALAVAYQVQCRLSDVAPVRAQGFDHTSQGAFAAAAGVAKGLGLDEQRTAHAIAISGTAYHSLRVTRTGAISEWKGLAYPNLGFGATHAAFLASRGVTGPMEVFEGNKGFMEAIAGRFRLDWGKEDLERVTRTIVKKFNAEIHSQSTLEAVLELKVANGLQAEAVARVDVATFDVAYHIIGGGEEGDKTIVRTKEQADHSIPYMVAAAILDGRVTPEQYLPEAIARPEVQRLLRRVSVKPVDSYSKRFPDEMPTRVTVHLKKGGTLEAEKHDYEGFFTRPMQWETVAQKFDQLSTPNADSALRRNIVTAVAELDTIKVSELIELLAAVKLPAGGLEGVQGEAA